MVHPTGIEPVVLFVRSEEWFHYHHGCIKYDAFWELTSSSFMFEFNRNKPTCVLIAQETNCSVLVNRWTGNTKLLSLLGVGKVLQTEHPRANCFFTSSVLTGSPVCLGCCKLFLSFVNYTCKNRATYIVGMIRIIRNSWSNIFGERHITPNRKERLTPSVWCWIRWIRWALYRSHPS